MHHRLQNNKVLIRMCTSADWSEPLLFTYNKIRFSQNEGGLYRGFKG